ncbi:molybdenum ABC transporter ATP-binding protein [Aggregicoccus sp. 17bor-14]|nr:MULTISPECIES: molybdenum ABC transporter ATP-binding protein [Myxococcaceae]MBF5046276.1 molybdenum ABC transporter ATP-binding protein [Simulacricoccus sp. 17bor-14]MRI91998.1 molybdenum ABC transporter ATP-binding protein [Aggregicoccus sp. 17bor-14]
MLELDVRLPLAAFALEVQARFGSRSLAVLGRSGSGKTSLLEVLAGLRHGARGRVAVEGRALLDSAQGLEVAPEKRRMGYVPQDALLFPHLGVEGNVRFGVRKGQRGGRVDEALELLGLVPLLGRSVQGLSGGERQRVALARALATDPALLLLDEPLAALDVELKERVLPFLLRVRDEARVPLVYVTHQLGEARALAEEALVLERGRVQAAGSASEVLGAPARAVLGAEGEENVLEGVLERPEEGGLRLRVTEALRLWVPDAPELQAGARAVYALLAEDLLLSVHPLEGVSARNVFAGAITALEPVGVDGAVATVRCAGVGLAVRLTRAAIAELRLQVGSPVYLAAKSSACRRLR